MMKVPRSLPLCLLLIACAAGPASAVDPSKRISQYGHTAWRIQDGYVPNPAMLTQTTDGYIWLGTGAGLMRFDGVTFSIWNPPAGQALPARSFGPLLGSRDGSLWIGTTGGLSRMRDGQLFNFDIAHAGYGISAIIEDSSGTIWFTRYRVSDSRGPLCRVNGNDIQCYGKAEGITATYGLGLTRDHTGNIWFGSTKLWRWAPDSTATSYFEEALTRTSGVGVVDVAAAPSGEVWAAIDAADPELGVRHYTNGRWTSYVVPGFDGATIRSHTLYLDRNNSLWIGTEGQGLYHVHNGIADHYGVADGLSGSSIGSVFEDREGNVWVVTEGGLDVFRDTPVVRVSSHQGLSAANVQSILALNDGAVWVANQGAIDVIPAGSITASAKVSGVPGLDTQAMFQDRSGRIWLAIDDGKLVFYEGGRFVDVKAADGSPPKNVGTVYAIVEDAAGDIWMSAFSSGQPHLVRISDQRVQEDIPLKGSFRRPPFLAADREAGIWMGADKLGRYRNGKLETIDFGAGEVRTFGMFVDATNAVWASTVKGLFRWSDGALNLMDSRHGLPCSSVYSTIDDAQGSLWVYAQCGIMRIPGPDLAAWALRPDSTKVTVRNFDALDGALPGLGSVKQPKVTRSPDGRIWFVSGIAAQMIEPARLRTNVLPPPVRIESLVADHRRYEGQGALSLPPLRGELEINYTALSLTIPRKVNFKYRLEGLNPDWQEAGTRRQAFYNDLAPGTYRFHVIASNNDGVWNETGATLDFTVAPTWYQATSFRLLCLLATVGMIWTAYQLRIAKVSRELSARFDERLAERTHLAQELHDTVLQTLQGSKMVADDALERTADQVRMRRAMEQLSTWLGQAMQEARTALHSLRMSTTQTNDLSAAFRRAIETGWNPATMAVTYSVTGGPRDLHPIARDEVYRIGYEAIRNALLHSAATRLQIELKYTKDLTLRVIDNGVGIDPAVADSGKAGHFGLKGMRERAMRIGGRLILESSPGSGTAIELTVPGRTIFQKTSDGRWARWTLWSRVRAAFHSKPRPATSDDYQDQTIR